MGFTGSRFKHTPVRLSASAGCCSNMNPAAPTFLAEMGLHRCCNSGHAEVLMLLVLTLPEFPSLPISLTRSFSFQTYVAASHTLFFRRLPARLGSQKRKCRCSASTCAAELLQWTTTLSFLERQDRKSICAEERKINPNRRAKLESW